MCGISGQIKFNGKVDIKNLHAMNNALRHRGPDDEGIYLNENSTTGLAHRRLSLIDLTKEGHQPLTNKNRTLWITYNGEVYNYRELRQELEKLGHQFHSQSDTEVILLGYEQWGTKVLDKLIGMFAFAIWDERKNELLIARDRFGIKPLYYYYQDKNFVFASEIKGVKANSEVSTTIDYSSFTDFFVYRYVPGPKSIWKEIKKLPAAHYLLLKSDGSFLIQEYWKIPFAEHRIPDNEATRKFDDLLYNSIQLHTRSDIPVSAFLSGGYDSSSIVYYLNRFGYNPSTYSIGFKGWDVSEHLYADMVAKQFGTKHHSLILDEQSLDILEHLAWVYDEPNGDTSIIPTYLICRETAKNEKAVMSGDGSDELLVGYPWQKDLYLQPLQPKKWWQFFKGEPQADVLGYYTSQMNIGRFDSAELKSMLNPELHSFINSDTDWYYKQLFEPSLPPLKAMQVLDLKHFMGEQILAKVDRASMAHSLEVRVPFLDHRICEFIFQLSPDVYYRKDETKHLLYQNIKDHLPQEILNRKKQGFVGPESYYSNISWYEKQLQDSVLVSTQLINQQYVANLITQKDHWRLWKLIVMEFWYRQWMK